MKALLLKDYYTLGKSLRSLALIVLLWSVIPMAFLNVFAMIYGSMIPYSAMAYDQQSRWNTFARMLPYREKDIVLSRYVLGWIFILASAAIVMLSQGILSQLSIPSAFFSALPLRILFVALCIGCLLLALNIPLMLRFGAEKARLVSALTTFLVFASAGALSGLADAESTAPVMLALPVLAVLAIIATAVSIPLSIRTLFPIVIFHVNFA